MYFSKCLLAVSVACATALELKKRGIPIGGAARAGGSSTSGTTAHIGDDVYRGISNDGNPPPRLGSGDELEGGLSSSGDELEGGFSSSVGNTLRPGSGTGHSGSTLSEQDALEYKPAERPNECLQKDCAELTVEVAKELVNVMGQSGQSSSTATTTRASITTRIHSPLGTSLSTRPAMPNYDIATAMTLPQEGIALFDANEQEMYFEDRMCFYANIQRRYADVATATSGRLTGKFR